MHTRGDVGCMTMVDATHSLLGSQKLLSLGSHLRSLGKLVRHMDVWAGSAKQSLSPLGASSVRVVDPQFGLLQHVCMQGCGGRWQGDSYVV